jgi:hypothetical protein
VIAEDKAVDRICKGFINCKDEGFLCSFCKGCEMTLFHGLGIMQVQRIILYNIIDTL